MNHAFLLLLLPVLFPAWGALHGAPAKGTKTDDAPPSLKLSYQPIYPREQLLAGQPGTVSVAFTVNSLGRVVSPRLENASAPAFGEAVLACLPYWEFEPARRAGLPAPASLRQKISFKPSVDSFFSIQPYDVEQRPIPILPIVGPRPVYPESLRSKNLKGFADVVITVDAKGQVTQTRLGEYNHKDFGQPALDAAGKWRFRPFDPKLLYEQEKGTKPLFLEPAYGNYQLVLTLLFHPGAKGQPFDLRRVGE